MYFFRFFHDKPWHYCHLWNPAFVNPRSLLVFHGYASHRRHLWNLACLKRLGRLIFHESASHKSQMWNPARPMNPARLRIQHGSGIQRDHEPGATTHPAFLKEPKRAGFPLKNLMFQLSLGCKSSCLSAANQAASQLQIKPPLSCLTAANQVVSRMYIKLSLSCLSVVSKSHLSCISARNIGLIYRTGKKSIYILEKTFALVLEITSQVRGEMAL